MPFYPKITTVNFTHTTNLRYISLFLLWVEYWLEILETILKLTHKYEWRCHNNLLLQLWAVSHAIRNDSCLSTIHKRSYSSVCTIRGPGKWLQKSLFRYISFTINMAVFFFNFIFWLRCMSCGMLVPRPGIEPVPPALGAQSLNHWTTREVPAVLFLKLDIIRTRKSLLKICDHPSRS